MRITEKTTTIRILAIPVLFSAFVLFYDLGDRMLWGDEAETALLGANIIKYGVPKATDGKNYVTLIGAGRDTNKDDIWVWRPWLDLYLTAASFALFGQTTATARLPFVLIAFLSVIFLAFIAHRFYRKKEVTLITILLLVTNVSFILHARQCRYYAVICLAQMSLIYGFQRLLSGRSKSGIIFFASALIVQFYCNYIIVLPNILAIGITTLIVYRKHPLLIRNVMIGLGIFTMFIVPWLYYAQPWSQTGKLEIRHFAHNLLYRLIQINFQIVPYVLLLAPAVMYFTRRGKQVAESLNTTEYSTKIFLWILLPAFLLVLSVTPGPFFRYLLPLMPALLLLSSGIIVDYIKSKVFRYSLVAVLCMSNVIPVFAAYPVQCKVGMPIVQYIREITTKYDNKLEDVVLYLKKNARPEETILVADPEFPLIFYTGMHVIDARLQRNNLNNLPDWIFARSASSPVNAPEFILPQVVEKVYEPIVLPVHDSPLLDNYPEPGIHASFTSNKFTGFKIYRKINQAMGNGQ